MFYCVNKYPFITYLKQNARQFSLCILPFFSLFIFLANARARTHSLHVHWNLLYDNDPNRYFTWNSFFFTSYFPSTSVVVFFCFSWHGISIVIAFIVKLINICCYHYGFVVVYTETIENCVLKEAMAKCWSIYLKHAMPFVLDIWVYVLYAIGFSSVFRILFFVFFPLYLEIAIPFRFTLVGEILFVRSNA